MNDLANKSIVGQNQIDAPYPEERVLARGDASRARPYRVKCPRCQHFLCSVKILPGALDKDVPLAEIELRCRKCKRYDVNFTIVLAAHAAGESAQ